MKDFKAFQKTLVQNLEIIKVKVVRVVKKMAIQHMEKNYPLSY